MPQDNYLEHDNFHQSFHQDCSTCWSERKANREATRKLREELGTNIWQGRVEDFIRNPKPLG